jgi:large subunit ribosomal protein L17
MRHLKKGKKFSRKRDQRRALLKNLAAQVILKEKIITTPARAKEARKVVERLITIAKKQNLAALRELKRYLPARAVKKAYFELAPLYQKRHGGYTRIVRLLKRRIKDNSEQAILELVK